MEKRLSSQSFEAEIRAELERILASPAFATSRRCRDFLRHVVERALSGQAESLKERTIAVNLFGRPADSDLEKDSTVRVCASHVRRRLAEYYRPSTGDDTHWRIELPAGSYAPVFHPPGAMEIHKVPEARPLPRRRRLAAGLIVVVSAALAAAALWRMASSPPAPARAFWGPAIASSAGGVAVVLPQGADAGHAAAAAEIVHFFRSWKRPATVTAPGGVAGPAEGGWSFVFLGPPLPPEAGTWPDAPPVRLAPDGGGRWAIVEEDGRRWPASEEAARRKYVAIFRIPRESGRRISVWIAGADADSTERAARLVVEKAALQRLVSRLPEGWERRKTAFVLDPGGAEEGAFELLAVRTW